MADENYSNLEPIEEKDLDLEGKFKQENTEMKKSENFLSESVSVPEKNIGSKEKNQESEKKYTKILSKVKKNDKKNDSDSLGDDSVDDEAEVISKEKDVETKVKSLVNIAQNKGVVHAVKVAQQLEDNYFLDELHDRLLSDELHNALLKKGLIQDI